MLKTNEQARKTVPNSACIPSNYSRLIARVLELQVRDLPSLLAMTQLTTNQFMQEDFLLTPQQQIQILHNALRLSNEEAFGLQLGNQLTPSSHGAMGFLANSSPNLFMALKAFQTYMPTRINFAHMELHTQQEWLECHHYIDLDVSSEIHRCLSEASVITLFKFAEHILGRPLDEAVISFMHPEPSYTHRYAESLPGQVEFSAPYTCVKIPIHLCQIPNVSANHENYLLALYQCEMMLTQLNSNTNTCKYQIQKMMLSHPPGVLNEDAAAAELFICKRTLARRLEKEGTSFRQIRDDILSQQASSYLRDSHMSVEAIAALLNYHDSANFRRAFKRWFQLSPGQYRQQLGAE
jgi:AraC-like DNA-binding protein